MENTFEYGIGVLIDEETMDFDVDEMKKAGYCIWDVKPGPMLHLTASVRMVIASVTLGPSSTRNFCHRWDMCQNQKHIMKYISKKEEMVCSVNCGFL